MLAILSKALLFLAAIIVTCLAVKMSFVYPDVKNENDKEIKATYWVLFVISVALAVIFSVGFCSTI